MKCSPFSKSFRKRGTLMHRHGGRFMQHSMRHCVDEYGGYASTSSSSSDDEGPKNRQIESGNDMQRKMGPHCMKSKHDFGMMHGRKHGHDMMHRMRHGQGMMHKMRHHHGIKHGHGMLHGRKHDHGMVHRMRHGHGRGMMHEMRHGHGMKHCHDMKQGKRRDHFMEHRMKHRHGMKYKMHHGHGKKHGHGHGPGMHHKLRKEFELCSSDNQNEERPIEVATENMNENSDEAFIFYKPKTSAQVMKENNKFQISLETSYYQPEEVSVKVMDGKIDVSAMHESMEDNIYEFHEMYRSFDIPNNVNPESITAHLDADGKLVIEAACNDQGEGSLNEREVPVIRVSE